MSEVADFFKRAAERTGFQREYFLEKDLPTSISNTVVLPLFGDHRAMFVMSSLLLNRFKQEIWRGKYMVLASWPGWRGMFPYVDEYWSPKDSSLVKTLAANANNCYNSAQLAPDIVRGFIEVFANVKTFKDLSNYYDGVNFGSRFWGEFKEMRRFLPEIPADNMIREGFRTQIDRLPGKRVLVFPNRKIRSWQRGKVQVLDTPRAFWVHVIGRLLDEGYSPVLLQDAFTFDMSPDFADKCIYLVSPHITETLCAMRYIGCTLDMFSGVSRLSISARTPFLAVDERMRFVEHKEYEIDDLCCEDLPKRYVFSHPTLLLTGGPREWDMSLLDSVMANLNKFASGLGEDQSRISSRELDEVVSYDRVRQHKNNRLGLRFISSSKLKKEATTKER